MRPNNPPPGIYGHNRTMVTPHYAVMPPEGILESKLPGWRATNVRFHTSPSMGARFAQALLEIAPGGGTTAPVNDGLEHFLYVVSGTLELAIDAVADVLEPGGYAYAAAGSTVGLHARSDVRAIWIKRPYEPAQGHKIPRSLLGHRDHIERRLKHTEGRAWQHLLPDEDLSFDMALNILSFAPGTYFPFVETHIMEHGLLMLAGQGVYRLEDSWYPVAAGDAIWMAPYCAQWFAATGKTPARYLYYKDVNRPAL